MTPRSAGGPGALSPGPPACSGSVLAIRMLPPGGSPWPPTDHGSPARGVGLGQEQRCASVNGPVMVQVCGAEILQRPIGSRGGVVAHQGVDMPEGLHGAVDDAGRGIDLAQVGMKVDQVGSALKVGAD